MKKSKYLAIYEWLSDQIRERKFLPGDRIPNEMELAAKFGVHRMTVRQAINKLVGDHIIVRKRNKGTFLLAERSPVLTRTLDNVPTYHDDIVRAGLTPGYKTLAARTIPGDAQVSSQLGLAEGEPVTYVHRLIYASEVPIAIEKAYVPESLFPGLAELNLDSVLYNIMLTRYNLAPTYSRHEISVLMPSEEERRLLKIKDGTPCMLVESLVFDQNGAAIEFSFSLHRGDKYRFRCSRGQYAGSSVTS